MNLSFKKKSKNKKSLDKIKSFLEEELPVGQKKISKKRFTSFELCFISFMCLLFGVVSGCLLSLYTNSVLGTKITGKVSEFLNVYNNVTNNYYEKVDKDLLIDAAISGMLGSLGDEHSFYLNQEETSSFNKNIDGSFIGVGITIQYKDDISTVIDIFKNSPAEKAGVQVGDILRKVNNVDVSKKDSNEIAELIKGDIGKKIKLTVSRNSEEKVFNIVLGKIEIESVFSELKEINNKKIGYISISNFAANTFEQFNNNLKALEKNKIDSLIIDVRSNTGGHLTQATKILDLFFDKGTILYQIETKNKKQKYESKSNENRKYPVVVLVNHLSASASEVLTACFMDNYSNATVVGATTYGKGTVQKASELSNGSSYKITTDKWLTPKGKWINKKGIKPDVEVEDNIDSEEDEQLKEALNILSK